MQEPYRADDELAADIAAASRNPDTFTLWWLGQSGFLLQWQHHRLLFDPYLSDSLTEKYANSDRPHVRMTRRTIAPDRLEEIEVVTATHQHTDHLDAETLRSLFLVNPSLRLICPAAWSALASERSGPPSAAIVPLDADETVGLGPWTVAAIPASHETIERDDRGHCRALGYIVRFGHWTIYHAGDTVRYDGQAERLRDWALDIVMLPINGRAPARGVPGNLTGEEAAALARDARARLAVPCHFDMFAFNTASPAGFVREAARLGQAVRVLRQGEALTAGDLEGA